MTTTMLEPNTVELLRDCCSCGAPAIILSPEMGAVCHARFTAVSPESVTLDLSEGTNLLPEGTRCCISFSHGGSSCAYFATVLEYQHVPPPEPSHLILEITAKVIGTEARTAYRVPIGKKPAPCARLSTQDGQILLPIPIDISLTGILVEFATAEDPDLTPSEEVDLELHLGDDTVHLRAEVRRRDGHRYGLFFPETVTKCGVQAPQSLRNIVENLERAWLQKRVR